MKEPKLMKPKGWGGLRSIHVSRHLSNKKPCKVIGMSMFALLMFTMLGGSRNLSEMSQPPDDDELVAARAEEKLLAHPSGIASSRNVSFRLEPRVTNFDASRKSWRKDHPKVRDGRPKVLLVTGSQPVPCSRPIDTHMLLKTGKNKVHYCRIHDIPMHYSLVEVDPEFSGAWAKITVLRTLMLGQPEMDWFWWLDSESVITDLDMKLPLTKYKGYNLVVHGDERRVFELKDWQALNTGNFLIRNCQWSLRLLDAWGSLGLASNRGRVGAVLSNALHGRPDGLEADDQSALVYLLSAEKEVWAPKVYLEKEFTFTAFYTEVGERLKEMGKYDHGDLRRPMVTTFAGCICCSRAGAETCARKQCHREMDLAMDVADDGMFRKYGYKYRQLGVPELVAIPNHKVEAVPVPSTVQRPDFHGFHIHRLPGPQVDDWDALRRAWFDSHPSVKRKNDLGRPKTMIVTGASIRECAHPVGEQSLLLALQNKADYARVHDMSIYYGMVDFDQDLDIWWTKIPSIRVLMLAHPEVEWFWWCDGDAVITDMSFDIPYEKFDAEGQNMVIYGDYDLVFNKRDELGVNAGIYIVRNCQWTLNLFDIWAAVGVKGVRDEAGKKFAEVLTGQWLDKPSNDQTALLYILVTDKEKEWSPHIRLERTFTMSGYWKVLCPRFEHMKMHGKPGSGNEDFPWITHFAGCQPCGVISGHFDLDECRTQIQRAFHFAEDQTLKAFGLEHVALGNPQVHRIPVSSL